MPEESTNPDQSETTERADQPPVNETEGATDIGNPVAEPASEAPGPVPDVAPAPPVPEVATAPPAVAVARPAYVDPKLIGRAAVAGAVGVGFAFAASIVVAFLVFLLAVMTGGTGSGGSSPSGPVGDVEIGGIPFLGPLLWLTVAGLYGQFSVAAEVGAAGVSGAFGATITLVPIFILLTAIVGTAWWSYRLERAARTEGRGRLWVLAAAAGLAAAIISILASIIGRSTVTAGAFGALGELAGSTLTFASFAGPLFTVALASVLGRWLARGPVFGHFGASLWHAPSRFRWGTRDAYDYLVVVLVLFTVIGFIASFFVGSGAAALWPIGAGIYTGVAAALGHFGGYSLTAPSIPEMSGMGGGTVAIFSPDVSGWVWLLPLMAIVAALAASVFIARRRTLAPQPVQQAWRLPAFIAAAALILGLTSGSAYLLGGASALGASLSFNAAVLPAWWTFIVAALWGAGVEALVRWVAPQILATWPALGRIKLAGDGIAPLQPVGATAVSGAGATARVAPVGVEVGASDAAIGDPLAGPVDQNTGAPSPAVAPAPPKPLSPKAKRGLLIGGITVGAVAILSIVGAVTVNVLQSTVFSPKPAVEAYVADIAEGRFAEAWAATPQTTSGGTSLVRADSVELIEGISEVAVGDPVGEGETRSMEVSFDLDGQRDSTSVTVRSAGKHLLFFDVWEIEQGLESVASVNAGGVDEMTVGGVPIALTDGWAEMIAYPAVYDVIGPESEWVTTVTQPLVVSSSLGGSVSAAAEATPALAEEVQAQVDAFVDDCATQAVAEPEGCPFSAYAFGESQGWAWTIVDYPVIELSGLDYFASVETGEAEATYQRQSFSGEWTDSETSRSFWVRGNLVIEGDSVEITMN